MGQAANNGGRQAKLDEKKTRAAGRQPQAVRKQVKDAFEEQPAKGKAGGAFGKNDRANRTNIGFTQGAGGGGGTPSRPYASPDKVGRSKRPARKGGT
jgi:hypothetical protein